MKPEELRYSETHEWVALGTEDGQLLATIGISAFAVEQLTDLVYMQLPAIGKQLAVGDEFGEVESVKAVSSLYSPVAGEVVAVNTELPNSLEWLNSDPYGQGWIIKVKVSDPAAVHQLLDFAAYQKQCAEHG
ncbi:MAG: glycine cleavage system protein GcvH [Planctomycetota bacterium]